MIELTDEQRQAVKNGEVIRIAVPEFPEEVVLLSATEYEQMQRMLSDLEDRGAALRYSMNQARTVAKENPY